MSTEQLGERVDAYLDGSMAAEEVRAFEAALIEPEVAQALAEGLLLRDLLAAPDPERDGLPEGLTAQIEAALGVDEGAERGRGERRFGRLRAALSGAGWGLRGPAQAALPATEGLSATRAWWRLLRGKGV